MGAPSPSKSLRPPDVRQHELPTASPYPLVSLYHCISGRYPDSRGSQRCRPPGGCPSRSSLPLPCPPRVLGSWHTQTPYYERADRYACSQKLNRNGVAALGRECQEAGAKNLRRSWALGCFAITGYMSPMRDQSTMSAGSWRHNTSVTKSPFNLGYMPENTANSN